MFTAGELAKRLGISARTVRFYDEKGILCPVDHSESGYRIYDESSVEKLQKILMLRFLDFSLEQIREMVKTDNSDIRQSLKEQEELEIHLTDYSEGMLESAQKTVSKIQETYPEKRLTFVFERKDAENFTYPSADFDRVMANHMLPHLKKEARPMLYQKIQELLKKDAIFSCSLIGREHNREIHQMVRRFYPEIKIPSKSFDIFLETAEEELQPFFSGIEWWEQDNDLLVPDAELVYDYVASYSKEAAEILQKDRANFLKRIENDKNPDGLFYIHKSTGVVVCRRPDL